MNSNMQQELSQLFLKAKCVKVYADISEFERLINSIKEYGEYRLDWDEGVGEEWARFLNSKGEIVLMLNIKIGIVFLRKNHVSSNIYRTLNELFIVEVDNYGEDIWCIDLSVIQNDLPEMLWRASTEAVNPEKMSLQDLYWATV